MSENPLQVFFETCPPGRMVEIDSLAHEVKRSGYHSTIFSAPRIKLYCENDLCLGVRVFEPMGEVVVDLGNSKDFYIYYMCRNCKKNHKKYSLLLTLNPDGKSGRIYKYGEFPAFGPQTPAKLISLIGPERDYFIKGRRSESQGLGIAAFAYYRRVIENQKNRIFDEIIKVSSKVGAAPELLADLERAKNETQFSKSIHEIKHGIPQVLLIGGHNPILLLHSALSEGLHAQTDEQCLEIATSVRIVMTELVERMALALKDEAELTSAVSRLLAKK